MRFPRHSLGLGIQLSPPFDMRPAAKVARSRRERMRTGGEKMAVLAFPGLAFLLAFLVPFFLIVEIRFQMI
jgi:hypothetical protein